MEETGKWIAGVILSLGALITTWVLAKRSSDKELRNKIDKKADQEYVDRELKKLTENVNSKIDEHVRESATASQMMVELITAQKSLITSIDENVKIVLNTMIKK